MNFNDLIQEIEILFATYKNDNPNCYLICEIIDTRVKNDVTYVWSRRWNKFVIESN